MKFTDKAIEKLKPTAKHFTMREDNSPGFACKVAPNGAKTFYYMKKVG